MPARLPLLVLPLDVDEDGVEVDLLVVRVVGGRFTFVSSAVVVTSAVVGPLRSRGPPTRTLLPKDLAGKGKSGVWLWPIRLVGFVSLLTGSR